MLFMSSNVFSQLSLLYVEDEPLISLDAMSALEKCGFCELACAYTLKSAVAESSQRIFDCAILDIRLDRGMSSISLGKSLVKQGTMVILASGNGLDKAALKEDGFHYFYTKPYNIREIIECIEHYFSNRL